MLQILAEVLGFYFTYGDLKQENTGSIFVTFGDANSYALRQQQLGRVGNSHHGQ